MPKSIDITDEEVDKEDVTLELYNKKIDYLFSKINWAKSFLDAKAIRIMNTMDKDLLYLLNKRNLK